MERVARLTGFIAAHSIWCVSDGGPLIPMIGFERADGSRGVHRFLTDRLEDGVEQAREWLGKNPEGAVAAVAAFDGYVPLPAGKQFAVYRPKFIQVDIANPDYGALADHFFAGVDSHEKGAEVWNARIDQSQ